MSSGSQTWTGWPSLHCQVILGGHHPLLGFSHGISALCPAVWHEHRTYQGE